jgi:hypothetical protein
VIKFHNFTKKQKDPEMGEIKNEKSIDCNNVLKNKNVIASNIRVLFIQKMYNVLQVKHTVKQACICIRSKPT